MENKNTSSGYDSCLAIIFIGTFGVLAPIVITFQSLTSDAMVIRVSFLVSVLLMILCFGFIPNLGWKFAGAAAVAFIYAMIFCSWYFEHELYGSYDDGGLGDLIFMFLSTFTLLVPCFAAGIFIEGQRISYKRKRMEKKNQKVNVQIEEIQSENRILLEKVENRESSLRLVKLLGLCGGDIAAIEADSTFREISSIQNSIAANEEKIQSLRSEIERNKVIIKE